MDINSILGTTSIFILALVLGSMVFFAFIFTPLVFTKLPPEKSGPFIRQVFPVYSQAMAALTLLAAIMIWNQPEAIAVGVVFVFFVVGWLIIMPIINRYRDAQLGGQKDAAKPFKMWHKLSVAINSLQLATVAIVFIRLVN